MPIDHDETDDEREERLREEKREAQIMQDQCAVTRILDLSERQPLAVPTADQPLLSSVSLVINTSGDDDAGDDDVSEEGDSEDAEDDR
jgi:hypothetical protein